MNKLQREKMYSEIQKHGQNLLAIFTSAIIKEPTLLCKKLRYYEVRAEESTTRLCNGGSEGQLQFAEESLDRIEIAVKKLLGITDDEVMFINRDPRGYALKMTEKFSEGKKIHKDWGGYGILAPDYTPNE